MRLIRDWPTIRNLKKIPSIAFCGLEASYARFFWPRYFAALATDLFEREKRKPTHPINAALNYGYGFLYHAMEWQCLASGLDPTDRHHP